MHGLLLIGVLGMVRVKAGPHNRARTEYHDAL